MNNQTMRKFMALGMVALLSLTLALALVSCQPKTEEPAAEAPATETTPMEDHSMTSDSTMAAPEGEGAMSDSTAH